MSKERLEKAKKILNHIKGYGVYDGNDDIEIFEWLIQQVERVEELEELNRILSSDKSMFIEELVREQHQNKRYREVLEFYADEENYEFETIVSDCDIEVVSKVLDDYGQKARQALECDLE